MTNDEKLSLMWEMALKGINIIDLLFEDESFSDYVNKLNDSNSTTQLTN